MKKFGCIGMVLVLCTVFFSGCGSTFSADENTVYVQKNGKVVTVDIDDLDQDYYDEEELKNFVDDEITAYTDEHGKGTVKLSDLTVKDGTAVLKMQYKTAEDYTAFNGIELYQGSVVKALAAGYDFDASFSKVEDGSMAVSVDRKEILEEDSLKAVIIKADIDVKVDGEILYVSTENVTVTGKDSISIREEGRSEESFETDVYTYIIYK